MNLTVTWVRDWIATSCKLIGEHRAELNTLDREIGDGDHGENMDRGFLAARDKLEQLPPSASMSQALAAVASALISTIGGAAGPLYGTAFLRASATAAEELDARAVADLLSAARDGILERGKAQSGDKTMIDAWNPAVQAAVAAAANGEDPVSVLVAAAGAAAAGAQATESLIARKGRASYLGERAIGHRDPGAQSTVLILRAAQAAAEIARD